MAIMYMAVYIMHISMRKVIMIMHGMYMMTYMMHAIIVHDDHIIYMVSLILHMTYLCMIMCIVIMCCCTW